ncbi:MAG: hypothetical protein AVDCRST_MAG19-865 [uncultured Thermomicrobiales bacterium]|uniref:Uncharacterized protein n=1 Tax=uncultured Thermomicrobiales bacterium TaxID=1645740 RepID=A0A6J4UM58_9BACT|nr:MAG: hypothetical protein AVDCRST_MAG19-865 [uncultured Thermomicrobiales bacterium]
MAGQRARNLTGRDAVALQRDTRSLEPTSVAASARAAARNEGAGWVGDWA